MIVNVFATRLENALFETLPRMLFICIQYFTMALMAYSGSTTTFRAEQTAPILGRLLADAEGFEKAELKKFLIQIQSRNLKF